MPTERVNRLGYRVQELARSLGLPKSTLYDMIRRGELRAIRSGRVLVVLAEDLEGWKKDQRVSGIAQ